MAFTVIFTSKNNIIDSICGDKLFDVFQFSELSPDQGKTIKLVVLKLSAATVSRSRRIPPNGKNKSVRLGFSRESRRFSRRETCRWFSGVSLAFMRGH
jgi:hypothetical protein